MFVEFPIFVAVAAKPIGAVVVPFIRKTHRDAVVAEGPEFLKPTRQPQAARVREIVAFSYQRGGASLLDLLQSQQDYRSIQLGYVNLVGAYLSAANQLNMAVGREVLP